MEVTWQFPLSANLTKNIDIFRLSFQTVILMLGGIEESP